MMTKLLMTFIATAILYFTYKVLFGKCDRFGLCRMILLLMSVFAFVLPFISINISNFIPEMVSLRQNVDSFILEEVELIENEQTVRQFSLIDFARLTYIAGLVFFFLKFLLSIIRISSLKHGKRIETIDNYNLIYTNEEHIPFSFMNNIFLNGDNVDPLILKHEICHVKKYHSLDIILIELMIVVQWFNPFMRLIKRELQDIHEFIADDYVVEDEHDKSNYMMLLLQQCTADNYSNIANNFSFLLTKKRINMIAKKQKSKGIVIKVLLTLPVFALLLLANTNGNAKVVGLTANYDVKSVDSKTNATESLTADIQNNIQNDSIYNVCAKMPEFPGGTGELLNYMSSNIKYPKSAVEKNLEGRVFVMFVIEKDGSISNIEILKGFDKECDAEAVRVVSSMPKWNPGVNKEGEVVRTKYTIPVVYKLNSTE